MSEVDEVSVVDFVKGKIEVPKGVEKEK